MEAVLQEAQREFEELTARTLQRLRVAMEKELADAKADLAQKEEALRQRAPGIRTTVAVTSPESVAAASTPTPMRSIVASSCRQDIGAAPGTASQLRALFERKAAKRESNRVSSPRKEKAGDHNRLSFRAQEGMLRRRSSVQSVSEDRKASPSSFMQQHLILLLREGQFSRLLNEDCFVYSDLPVLPEEPRAAPGTPGRPEDHVASSA
eukprot:CAMPEP_0114651804 /NCGR_PEP_ID=MMETSP0191-20121206/8580_1 /TAXON_ID=126664 /ORGANISM="Sorites sp." /LENGTH=207 /DNA_ID=CAMNT_0001866125 /DNA_START=92 /DNA_END=716 /DNA_ORIENTATION=+